MTAPLRTWVPCNRGRACQKCGKDGWCSRSSDGQWEVCRRVDTGEGQERQDKFGVPFWLYRVDGAPVTSAKVEIQETTAELAKPDQLNAVYRDLLQQLELGDGHRGQLEQRGLTSEEIQRYGFRSCQNPTKMARIASELHRTHGDLCQQVPGWTTRDERPWINGAPGILIPTWDMDGNIVGIHIRRDRAEGDEGPKYIWLSSLNTGGPSPSCPPFFCFPTGLYKQGEVEAPDVWLVEGEFKAIAVARETKQLTISVAGVSLWKLALPVLEAVKARRVRLAYDSDWQSKDPDKIQAVRHVSKAILMAWRGLREAGFEVALATWPLEHGKGIDDLIQAGRKPNVFVGTDSWPTLRSIAAVTGVYTGGQTAAKGLPEFIPSVAPKQAEQFLRHFTPGVHSPYSDELVDAYVLCRKHGQELRTVVRNAVKKKVSPVSEWDNHVRTREAVFKRFWQTEMVLQAKADPTKRSKIMEVVPDAPLPVGYIVPAGWQVEITGVSRLEHTGEDESDTVPVCSAPIFPVARLWDIVQNTYSMRLAWWRDGAWSAQTWERQTLGVAREIVQLSGEGLPVDSVNALELIQYISASEAANLDVLPRVQQTSHLGWQGHHGDHGFLVGLQRARPDGGLESTLQMNLLPPSQWSQDQLMFRSKDRGEDQLAAGFRAEGTLEGWLGSIEPLLPFPRVLMLLYASFAAPMLEILKAPPFTVDLSYTTSAGKTTALRVAASVWGTPDERDPTPIIQSWEATRVHVERSLGLCNGLPLILDDTARASKPEFISKVVYDVSSGRGRGRGSRLGIAESVSWRTIMLSTGEQKITHFAELGGAHSRAICLWGQPFGEQSGAIGRLINHLYSGLMANHGHAGPAWVSWILTNRSRWTEWQERFRVCRDSYAEQAGDNAVAGRFSDYFAVLEVTKQLVHEALAMPWPEPYDLLQVLRDEILAEAQEADRARIALDLVLGWVASQPGAFWNKLNTDQTGAVRPQVAPNGGWVGRWDYDPDIPPDRTLDQVCPLRQKRSEYVAIYPHHLKAKLEASGYHFETTIRTWRDRKWLAIDDDKGRMTKLVRVDRVRAWMVCLKVVGL